jgi:ABC-2 type transport system ATP-binding protein
VTHPIEVVALAKTFRQGFFMRKVEAVRGISFSAKEGEIVGFLGPNGAGKTTTIKMLTGLIRPTGGRATVFGHDVPSREAMKRVGFLPENPYVYPYLTPREFVTLCGRLSGLSGAELGRQTNASLERTGIAYAGDRQVRRLSKGMLQRTGLAAALVARPDLLILDEPMSGLDPVGRKEVRDLILEERTAGRTVFFSTHILGDVETLCDQVVILRKGMVVVSGRVRDLVKSDVRLVDVTLERATTELEGGIARVGCEVRRVAGSLVATVEGEGKVGDILRLALEHGATVVEVAPRKETLENLFMRRAIDEEPERPAA